MTDGLQNHVSSERQLARIARSLETWERARVTRVGFLGTGIMGDNSGLPYALWRGNSTLPFSTLFYPYSYPQQSRWYGDPLVPDPGRLIRVQMIIVANQDRGILRSGCIPALRPQATEEKGKNRMVQWGCLPGEGLWVLLFSLGESESGYVRGRGRSYFVVGSKLFACGH